MRKTRARQILRRILLPLTLVSALAISSCATPYYEPIYSSYKKPLTAEQLKRRDKKVKELIRKLKQGDWYARHDAAHELGEIGSVKAVSALVRALKDPKLIVREKALESLEAIAKANPDNPELAKAVPALSQALRYEKSYMRIKVLNALANIGKPAVPVLSRALEQGDMWFVDDVIDALAKIGEPAIPALSKALRFNKMYLKGKAINALADIGTPAIPALLEAVKYDEYNVYHPAIKWKVSRTIKNMGKSAVPALIKAVEDFDSVAPGLLVSFAKYDDESKRKIVPALTKATKYFCTAMQKEAAKALGEIGAKEAVPALIEALQDMHSKVRLEMVWALKKIGDKRALPALSRLAEKDPDMYVRKAAEDAVFHVKMRLAW